MREVDLSLGQQGRVKLSDGREWWCTLIEPSSDNDGSFCLRIESGWYNEYWKDGRSKCCGIVYNKEGVPVESCIGASVVEFEPMDAVQAARLGLDSCTNP